jgi:outer membrane protein TolC
LEITVEIKTAYEAFRSARALVASMEQDLLGAAEKARALSTRLYRTQASTLTDFLDTQRAFDETMRSYYQAQAEYRRAAMQLNASVGKEIIQWSATRVTRSEH